MTTKYFAGLMAGGRGTRLWPLSRKSHLKQCLPLFNGESLLNKTIQRFHDAASTQIICTKEIQGLMEPGINGQCSFLCEPRPANTAAAVAFFIYTLLEQGASRDDVAIVSGTDYFIRDEQGFRKAFEGAVNASAETAGIVLLGVDPEGFPSTEYGYLVKEQHQEFSKLKRFEEKPNLARAQELLKENALWNSGMFLGTIGSFCDAIEKTEISLIPSKQTAVSLYETCVEKNFDQAVLEKHDKVFAFDLRCGWDDVGSWDRMFELADQHPYEGMAEQVHVFNLSEKKIILNTEQDLSVFVDGDLVYITDKKRAKNSKKILVSLEEKGRWEYQ